MFAPLLSFQIRKSRVRRSSSNPKKDDFKVTASTKVCSKHFTPDNYKNFSSKKRALKDNAVPTIFPCSETKRRKPPTRRYETSETETSSETEQFGDENDKDIQVELPIPCIHQFSIEVLKSSKPKLKLFQFYTGFNNYAIFKHVLELIVPDSDRKNINYWDRRSSKSYISGFELFDSDDDGDILFDSDEDDGREKPPKRTHKLSVEDEFLLSLMKHKLGLYNKDLAVRFCIALSTVTKIVKTWINLIYTRLGSISIFPSRDVIIRNMTQEFKEQYPTSMIIVDCTEIKIQMPSSLIRKSQTYSNYKSANTFKGLVGVDSRGGIMFVSHLYTGSISDKEICQRSGFYDLLKLKQETGELMAGDAVMADKGFDIRNELDKIGMKLNIPPFLGKRKQLSKDDVLETQRIAHHRIHVERAIGKVKIFHIFDRPFFLKSAGIANQICTDCCLLSNFQDPLMVNVNVDP